VENTFIGKNRIRKHAKNYGLTTDILVDMPMQSENMAWDSPIEALPIFKLDTDFRRALEKMAQIEEITQTLPGINCGACGAPTCRVLAEDIVNKTATISRCVVLQMQHEKK
jgi:uncharacterized ferredoxin-like protein